ncbi:MAG: hypothetical protein JNM84_12920, partial [Planctomycetes bacterium]|nr:hypothetical protein [Planctomycetota bacterium]
EQTPTHLPFTFRLFDGRMFVDRVAESAPALSRGDEILALDGRATSELLEQVGRTVNLDGFTDAARASRLESAYEYRDSGFDHFLPLFHGFRERFALRIRSRVGGELRELEVAAIRTSKNRALAEGGASDFASGVRFEVLSPGVAALAIDTFVNYRRTVDPESVFGPLFERLRTEKIQTLILDLRICGGGSDDVPLALLRRAIQEPIELARRPVVRSRRVGDLEPHLTTWVPNAFNLPEAMFRSLPDGSGYELLEPGAPTVIEPHSEQRFTGRWIALIGPRNASGATNLLAVLRERVPGLVLIGEETAGNVEGTNGGLLFFLTLPESGIRVNLPVKRTWNPISFDTEGRGLRPDIAAAETLESWLAGTDVALAAAREIAAR